jgi:hypothetical protein
MPPDRHNDIRQYFSPPRNRGSQAASNDDGEQIISPSAHVADPAGSNQHHPRRRNRRILTSDDDIPMPPGNAATAANDRPADQNSNARGDHAIVIASSEEDEPNDMWVRPRHNPQQTDHLQQQENIPPQPALAMQSPSPPAHIRRRHHQQSHCNTRSRRRRLEAEAVESAASDDPSSECIESDTDAQDLYRSAIRGVRNARQARQQIRSATQHCPVCAKFAAFIAHFI